MTKFNIIQTVGGIDSRKQKWSVIDGQRLPGGYAENGAKEVASNLTYDLAKATAAIMNENN